MESRGERLIGLLRGYAELLLSLTKKWRELLESYPEEIRIFSEPTEMSKVVEGLSDEEAGKILKTLLELASIASKISKMASLDVEEVKELEIKLEKIMERLRAR